MAVLTAAALLVQGYIYLSRGTYDLARVASADPDAHADIKTFWASAVALLHGADIYRTGADLPNLNPPILTVLLAPLGLFDLMTAYRILALFTVGIVLACVLVVAREVQLPSTDTALAAVGVLLSAPLAATVGLGQVYALGLAALTAAWWGERRGHPALVGIGIGCAVALKPILAPLVLLPLAQRRPAATVVATGVAAGATLLGMLVAGHDAIARWLGLLIANPMPTFYNNASLPAAAARLTSVTEWSRPLVELPGGTLLGVAAGAGLVLVSLVRARATACGGTALWAVATASVAASSLAWNTYLVLVVPGIVLVLRHDRRAGYAVLAFLQIGEEWPSLWYGSELASALPLALYAAVIVGFWLALFRTAPFPHAPAAVSAGIPERVPAPSQGGTTNGRREGDAGPAATRTGSVAWSGRSRRFP